MRGRLFGDINTLSKKEVPFPDIFSSLEAFAALSRLRPKRKQFNSLPYVDFIFPLSERDMSFSKVLNNLFNSSIEYENFLVAELLVLLGCC